MKKLIVLFGILIPFLSIGQVSENATLRVTAPKMINLVTVADTLNTTASADTSLWNVSVPISSLGDFEYVCAADSISGTQAATIYLETSMTGGSSDDEWVLFATHTLTGAGHTEYRTAGVLVGKYVRDRIYAPTGTQSTRLVRTLKWKRM
jgi:hypothetical protein